MKTTSQKTASKPGPGTGDDVLVDPRWLEAHLHDPAVRVVEVDVSRAAYDEWHIDGAVLWNVYADLKDADYRPVEGAAVQRLLVRSGIRPDSTVVFYGYAPALGFWLMKLYGHADVRILDCSRGAWHGDGRARSSAATPAPDTSGYTLAGNSERLRADHAAVRGAIGDPGITILDVRTRDEYEGERFWPSGGMEPGGRAGHVPGAVHQPIDDLYDHRGAFRSAADLRAIFSAVPPGSGELITYCTIGGRASTAWFVLTYLLGRDNVRVYDGSWAEWGRMTNTPVEHGARGRVAYSEQRAHQEPGQPEAGG